ncbi:MAG: alpha/beta hydrolase [Oscillatoriales cyanobacterium SM2_1_8]|nr:alpha/beta hydrolase [Oscillatoriales cyanobacterium SM2_1_8]
MADPTPLALWIKRLFIPLRIVGLAYVGLLLVLFFNQDNMVFVPSRTVTETPQSVGLRFESWKIPTADGETLAAWFIPAPMAIATLVYCHGNGGNIGNRIPYLPIFHSLGLSVVLWDYRGYGQSTGRPSEAGFYQDAAAVMNYLQEQHQILPGPKTVVYGEILWVGGVASYLAAQYPVKGLVLGATFTAAVDRAAELYPFLPVWWLARSRFDTRARLPQITAPVLVLHSVEDEIIPIHHGRALYAAANQPKTLVELTGDHNNGFLDNAIAYGEALAKFLTSLP